LPSGATVTPRSTFTSNSGAPTLIGTRTAGATLRVPATWNGISVGARLRPVARDPPQLARRPEHQRRLSGVHAIAG
jgi:hypothetical protein